MDNSIEFQWIALVFAIIGAYLTALKTNRQRKYGFICFLVSNVAWLIVGYKEDSSPIMLQNVIFSIFSSIGLWNNRR